MDTRRLVAAASRLAVRISPTFSDGLTTFSKADVRALVAVIDRDGGMSTERSRIKTLLNAYHVGEEIALSERDAQTLATALERLTRDIDRARRIRRGEYVGPMSGSEAVAFMRGRHGI